MAIISLVVYDIPDTQEVAVAVTTEDVEEGKMTNAMVVAAEMMEVVGNYVADIGGTITEEVKQ